MLKKTVTYTDFDDVQREETLYFNLTRTDMVDLLDLLPKLEAWQSKTKGMKPDQQLPINDIREMLEIIKELVRLSYGERSEDGKQHRKSPEIFENFKATALYDALMFEMFKDTEQAVEFMIGILPKDISSDPAVMAARAQAETEIAQLPSSDMNATEQEVPAYIRENREPTRRELTSMSPDELQRAFQFKIDRKNQQA